MEAHCGIRIVVDAQGQRWPRSAVQDSDRADCCVVFRPHATVPSEERVRNPGRQRWVRGDAHTYAVPAEDSLHYVEVIRVALEGRVVVDDQERRTAGRRRAAELG